MITHQPIITAVNQRRIIRVVIAFNTLYILGHLLTNFYEISIQRYDGWIADGASGIVTNAFADTPDVGLNAGIQLGDQILSVNGVGWNEPVHDWSREEQDLLILRDGGEFFIRVFTQQYPLRWRLLNAVTPLTGIGLLLFSLLIWLRNPYHRTILLLVGTLQLLSIGMGTTFFVPPFGIMGVDARFLAGILFTPVLIHLHLRLIGFYQKRKRLSLGILTFLYGATAVLVIVYLVATHVQHHPFAQFNQIMLLNALIGMLLSLILLIWAYIKGTPLIRQRLRIVLVGSAFVYLFWIVLMLIPRLFLGINSLFPVYIAYPTLLFLPIVYLAGITKDGLIQTDKIINRAIVSLGVVLILGLFYLLVIAIVPNLIPAGWAGNPFNWSLITLLLVASFSPLRTRLQNSADRLLYGGWYDYRSVVDEMSHKLSGVVDGVELGGLLVDRLSEIMHLDGAALLLRRGTVLQSVRCTGGLPPPPDIGMTTPMAAALRQSSTPLSHTELKRQLPALQKQEMLEFTPEYFDAWIPLVRHEQLMGVLLLGKRYGAESVLVEDRPMLSALAWSAATAAENVQLVDRLAERAEEVSQLYDQTVTGREEERKRLARDLHDEIIQDLINLNHAAGIEGDSNQTVNFMRQQLQTTIADLRRVCTDLRPSALDDLSLRLAIEGYVVDVTAVSNLPITFIVDGDEADFDNKLSDEITTALFRILQEALTNIRRHAEATQVNVRLHIGETAVGETSVSLHVCDDGKGFTVPDQLGQYTAVGHFGLAGMQERLNLVGGKLVVESNKETGTCVQAIIHGNPA